MVTMLQSVVTAIALSFVKATFPSGSSNQDLGVNQSIFVPEGDIAVFNLKTNISVLDFIFRHRTRDIARIVWDNRPEQKHRYEIGYNFATFYRDDSYQGRSNVTAINHTEETATIMITISDLVLSDNGIYDAYDYQKGIIACWRLFVLNLKQIPSGIIIENEGVRILAEPAAFLIKDLGTKATMVWLLDGEYLNHTEYFMIQVGGIWTSRVPRALNGRNVTYRAVQNDETLSEINLTLNVAYGPNPPLTLLPSTTFYTLQKGETMPNIECKADCNPPCLVAWEGSNSTDVLRLGKASTSISGEYTCTARSRQNGTSRAVKRSIFVFVTDTTMATTAFSVLGGTQVLSLLLIGVLCVCLCSRQPQCSKCGTACQISCQPKENIEMGSGSVSPNERNQNVNQDHDNTYHYEALNAETRQNKLESETYSSVQMGTAIYSWRCINMTTDYVRLAFSENCVNGKTEPRS